MTVRLLVLSFYYPPDLGAGSFRASGLVAALKSKYPNAEIDVITTLPNRYSTFKLEAPEFEVIDRVTVRRLSLRKHRGGMVGQSLTFLDFFKQIKLLTNKKYDLIFATSSRLMTGALGAWVARKQKTKFYLDIRDIFVESISDVLPWFLSPALISCFSFVESFTVKNAVSVNLVSKGFGDYFRQRYPEKRFTYFTNGIDDEFVNFPMDAEPKRIDKVLRVVYAGNVGDGQGLHEFLPEIAARCADGHLSFHIFGDGGRMKDLSDAILHKGISNVHLHPPIEREALKREYQVADILLLHLAPHAAFRRVLPSKLFEYAATGRPIWAGVPGYCLEMMKEEVSGCAFFEPNDIEGALKALGELDITIHDRSEFASRYSRRKISESLAVDIMQFVTYGKTS